jgi:hypothetical protein
VGHRPSAGRFFIERVTASEETQVTTLILNGSIRALPGLGYSGELGLVG